MVRQYKIHTNLDGIDDKVWDVTNGKVRFYQPSNLGLQSTNNIWQSNGIGVMGTRSITQPQIEFKLETFGESLEENYQLMKDFVNDILSKKFVTLEYQTEIFQVYADLALADVTKTEGYGKNGTFSEKITFDIITKWYTYENLTFEKIQNGKVIAGKSKIYGGYKGSESALQNYNRLKANPSLNLPNLNLLDGTKDFSGRWERAEAWTNDGTYKGLAVKKRTGQWQGIYKVFTAPKSGVYTFSAYIKSSGSKADITRYVFVNDSPVPVVPDKVMGNNFDWLRDSISVTLKAGDKVSAKYDIAGAGLDSALWTAGHKWEEIMLITDGLTTIYPNFNLFTGTSNKPSTSMGGTWNISVIGVYKTPKVGQEYTLAVEVSEADHDVNVDVWSWNNAGERVAFLSTTRIKSGEKGHITFTWPDPKDSGATQIAANLSWTNDRDTGTYSYCKAKLELGSTATPWLPSEIESQNKQTSYMPSATELTTADISEYFGYNYIANQAYTYYGESNIERLSRWDIKDEIFSFVGMLYQNLPRVPTGVRFLDTIGNEYTAIVFNTAEPQSYILINTDVNDEIYQGWNGTIPLNLFPLLDFERYRTRIIKEGQMELINLTKAEFKIKRKADFV